MLQKRMMKKIYNFWLLVNLAFLVASCNFSYPSGNNSNQLSYSPIHIVFAVKDIEMLDRTDIHTSILSSYPPPIDPKHIIFTWAEERLRASGNGGKIEFILEEVLFKETKLPSTQQGWIASLKGSENSKYEAEYQITMNLYTDDSKTNKVASITVKSLSERAIEGEVSPAEKDKLLKEMLQELLRNAETQLESNIKTYFAGYVHFKG